MWPGPYMQSEGAVKKSSYLICHGLQEAHPVAKSFRGKALSFALMATRATECDAIFLFWEEKERHLILVKYG